MTEPPPTQPRLSTSRLSATTPEVPPTHPTPDELGQCMARMAAGDDAAVFTFARLFGDQVERAVRQAVGGMGRRDVLVDRDEINGLVLDVCLLIHDKAAGWQPGGAPPWVWARSAIRQLVSRSVGHRQVADETGIEGDVSSGNASVVDVTPDTWAALTARDEQLRLLDQALVACGSDRDRWVFLEYLTQQGSGDPSPAITVSAMFGLSPANVRQIVRRQKVKVRHFAESNEHHSSLLELRSVVAA